jgi:hypothetical protein
MSRLMKRALCLALVGAVWLGASSAPAEAGSITLADLKFGVVNRAEDDDFEFLINAGGTVGSPGYDVSHSTVPGGTHTVTGDTTAGVGDFIVGMIRFTALYAPPGNLVASAGPNERTFVGIFALKVTSTTEGNLFGVPHPIRLTNASVAEWTALGLPLIPANEGTAIMVFDDLDNINATVSDGPDAGDENFAEALATVGGTKLYELGFTGDPDEFWRATGPTGPFAAGYSTVASLGSFNAAVGVVARFNGAPELADIGPPFVTDENISTGDGKAKIAINGDVLGSGSQHGSFPVITDTDVFFMPVPEPASIVLFALGGLGVIGFGRRRLKVQAA